MTITGRLARFSRLGMIEDISNKPLRDFASCLQARLAPTPEAAAPEPAADAAPEAPAPEAAAPAAGPVAPTPAAPAPAAASPAGAPIQGFSLVLSVLYLRLARLFGRPGRWGR
jgi:hypothetical protein